MPGRFEQGCSGGYRDALSSPSGGEAKRRGAILSRRFFCVQWCGRLRLALGLIIVYFRANAGGGQYSQGITQLSRKARDGVPVLIGLIDGDR